MSKIYCASDFHIGDETANYPKIKEFLEIVRQDADKLILVGDTWDLWRNTAKTITSKDPFKSIHELLLDVAKDIPIHIIWGNHDFNLSKKLYLPNIKVTDDFVFENIFYCHGWRFDNQQRFGSHFYGWLVNHFPFLYQLFFKKPSEIIKDEYDERSFADPIHKEALKFINDNKIFKYIVMGHTHSPSINNKLIDCGDFLDSLSYIIIKDGIPKLKYLKH